MKSKNKTKELSILKIHGDLMIMLQKYLINMSDSLFLIMKNFKIT